MRPVLLVLAALAAGPAAADEVDVALERGSRALAGLAHPDGGWRSETYGLLRPGRALTPFALHALARSGRPIDPGVAARAFAFLERMTTPEGAVAAGDGVLDYPNYATAFAVLAYCDLRPDLWEAKVGRMVEYLLADQLVEPLGWTPEDLAYGGWGFGGEPRRRGMIVEPDLSRTVTVLEALRAAGVPGAHPVWAKARRFVERCQEMGADGGFLFNPVDLSANKTSWLLPAGERPGPYSPATVDGLRALLLCGARPDEEPVVRALAWLRAHPGLDLPGGLARKEPPHWDEGLRYYHWWSLARTLRLLPEPFVAGWRSEISRRVVDSMRPDGTWVNDVGLSREDDPIVATGFALLTLADCK